MRYSTYLEDYLEMYGYHMNKKLCEFAVNLMKDRRGEKLKPWSKELTEAFLRTNNIELRNNIGYDSVYFANMLRADFWGGGITDDQHLAIAIKDICDDVDGATTKAFDHFFIDCIAKGIPIFWEDMM